MATATIDTNLRQALLTIAKDCIAQGPGFAQEPYVLRVAADNLSIGDDLERQQSLLTIWHDLFRQGELSWGYNVDNPGPPFFHVPRR